MEFFDFLSLMQGKPTTATNGLTRVRTFARMVFMAVEVCVALALLAWAFNRLPLALRSSGEFLRRLSAVVASPLFVFLLGNSIVAALVAKSHGFSAAGTNADEPREEDLLHDAVVKSSGDPEPNASSTEEKNEEAVVYQDKEIILSQAGEEEKSPEASWSSDNDSDPGNVKVFRRTVSEKRMWRRREKKKSLRRCETAPVKDEDEDELSDEEFQRAVDDFIAKHLKIRREESLAVVVVNPKSNADLRSPLVEAVSSC